jgi:type IV pilus assembly protein PilM
MDDQPLWKKEVSFERKPKVENATGEPPVNDETPAPAFKQELSFKRADSAEAVEGDAAADPPAEETVWKKEVSFGRKVLREDEVLEAEPVVAEAATDEVAADEQSAGPPEQVSNPEPEPEEKVWTKEVSFSRAPREQSAESSEQVSNPEPEPEEKVWTKEVSFSRAPEAEPVAEPAADQQIVAEAQPVAEAEPAPEEPIDTLVVASVSAEVSAEPWDAPPVLPPAPVAEPLAVAEPLSASVPEPLPVEVLQPPVAAADLPPLVVEDEVAPKVPFWKKDLTLGGKKADKPAKPRKQRKQKDAPVAADDAPKVPFWKKELSLGGKKDDKSVEDHGQENIPPATVAEPVASDVPEAPVAAADLPPLFDDGAPKVPFWKKELSLGGKNGDKPAKEPKQKTPKVKAERAKKTKEPKEPKQAKQPKESKQKTPKVKAERGNTKGRLTGLKIGASQLAAARVANNGSAELLQVAREALAPGIIVGGELRDPDALAEALKDFFAKNGLPKKGVRLGIANNRIGVRTFEIAGIEDQKQLANAIRFRAQETLPIPIDEAVLDYQVLGEGVGEDGQPTKRILLVVAYRELIDRYVDACKQAGITLVGIDLEAFALLRALQAPQEGVGTDASAALVVVAIGHERSTFAVSDGRVCEFTRVLEWGGSALNVAIARAVDAAPSEVDATKRALSLMDEMVPDGITADQAKEARESMRRAIQTFARELVSSLQYYQNQPGSLGIGEIVLTGGTAHLPGLAGELERLIGVHVRVGDPLARMKVSKKVGQPEQIGSLAVAIGLGIED